MQSVTGRGFGGGESHCQNCHLLAILVEFARRDVIYASVKAHFQGPHIGVFVNLDPDPFEVYLADVSELLEALPTKNHPEVIDQARTEIEAAPAEGMVRVLFVRGGCFLKVHAPVLSQEQLDSLEHTWRNEDMFEYARELAPKIEGLGQPGKVLVLAPKDDLIVANFVKYHGVVAEALQTEAPGLYAVVHDVADLLEDLGHFPRGGRLSPLSETLQRSTHLRDQRQYYVDRRRVVDVISYEAFRILFSRELPQWLLVLAFLVILIHGLDRGNADGTE